MAALAGRENTHAEVGFRAVTHRSINPPTRYRGPSLEEGSVKPEDDSSAFDLNYMPQQAIKAQALADYNALFLNATEGNRGGGSLTT